MNEPAGANAHAVCPGDDVNRPAAQALGAVAAIEETKLPAGAGTHAERPVVPAKLGAEHCVGAD
jgi:hypothetical protein